MSASVRRRSSLSGLTPYIYVVPALGFFSLFVIVPALATVSWSLYRWDGLSPAVWVGLQNYSDLAADPLVALAFVHAIILVCFYAAIPIAIGLLLAVCLSRIGRRSFSTLRTLLFMPQVITPVVVAIGWRVVYDPNAGLLNQALKAVGLGGLTQAWLGDFTLALPAIGIVAVWIVSGFCMVLFLAGMQKISADLYDAARVDGAGVVQEFIAVTLPGLRYEIGIAAVLTLTAALRNFDIVFNMTRGGPGDSTIVPVLLVYRRAFVNGDIGSAAAIAVCVAIVVLAMALVTFRATEDSSS